MQKETRIKIKVLARLRSYNPKVWYTKVQQKSKRGDPDILMCVNGIFVAWELKTTTGKLSKLQLHALRQVSLAGGVARVVNPENIDKAFEELEWIIKNVNTERKAALPSQSITLPA